MKEIHLCIITFLVLGINATAVIGRQSQNQSLAQSEDCSCGVRKGVVDKRKPRIIKGTDAEPNEFPWRVALYFIKSTPSGYFCSGTILSSKWILTAAHCSNSIPKYVPLYVLAGAHDISETTEASRQWRQVNLRVVPSDEFDHYRYIDGNDIVLLRLSEDLELNDNVSPICLPFEVEEDDYNGHNVTASGWGTTGVTGHLSHVLQKADLPALSTTECRKSNWGNIIQDNMICTYEPGKDTCQGDSGGSIDLKDAETGRYFAIGIVSFGHGCALEGWPGVYTKVMTFLDFITETTGEDFCRIR